MDIYNADDFDVKVKSDESPVTEADEAADALISAGLREAFPDLPLVTEEQADTHGQSVRSFPSSIRSTAPRNSSTAAAISPSTSPCRERFARARPRLRAGQGRMFYTRRGRQRRGNRPLRPRYPGRDPCRCTSPSPTTAR